MNALAWRGWACRERLGVHPRRVHLDVAFGVEQRAVAGVEERMILERRDCRDDGLERAALGAQNARAQTYRRHHPAAALGALNSGTGVTSAAMRDERGKIARASHLTIWAGGPK